MDTSALSLGTALHGLSSERPSLGQADGPGLLRGHQEAVLWGNLQVTILGSHQCHVFCPVRRPVGERGQ